MADCLFCKIVKKEIPSNIVYEDANVIAFLDINPVNFGHTLVVPKVHVENMDDVAENVLVNSIKVVKKIAMALGKIAGGVNVIQNNKGAAGQLVNHIHFHVIPRYENDGLRHWPGKKYEEGQAEKLMEEVKKAINEVENF